MSAVSDVDRTRQVITYLCSIQMYMVGCCCEFPTPTTNLQNTSGSPPAAGSLFTALAALYPTIWTSTVDLVRVLEYGAARGVFRRFFDGTNTYWYIDLFMVKKNLDNKKYLSSCAAIKDCYATSPTPPNF